MEGDNNKKGKGNEKANGNEGGNGRKEASSAEGEVRGEKRYTYYAFVL